MATDSEREPTTAERAAAACGQVPHGLRRRDATVIGNGTIIFPAWG